MALYFLLIFFCFFASFGGIVVFIRWSRKNDVLDVPNERSSHSRPVPVGAGLVVSAVIIVSASAAELVGPSGFYPSSDRSLFIAYLAGSVILVAVSWIDDLTGVPALLRLIVQSAAAIGVIYFAGDWLYAFGVYGMPGAAVSFIWIVGLTNAYNFMDGIDGIAGVQAITAGLGWIVLGGLQSNETAVIIGSLTAVSMGAFLFFNWQPAKVFLGDSGSAFLGYTFSVLPILSFSEFDGGGARSPLLILLAAAGFAGPFVIDSSITFLKRLLTGERVWKPHRRHFYQAMVINGFTHSRVSLIYFGLGALCSAAAVVSISTGSKMIVPVTLLAVTITLVVVTFFARRSGKMTV